MLVRSTCGGQGHIDDVFRAKLPHLDIITEGAPVAAATVPA